MFCNDQRGNMREHTNVVYVAWCKGGSIKVSLTYYVNSFAISQFDLKFLFQRKGVLLKV